MGAHGDQHRGSRLNGAVRRRPLALNLEELEDRRVPSTACGQVPLAFEPNEGQADPGVSFLARGQGYAVSLTSGEAFLGLPGPGGALETLGLRLLGGNLLADAQGQDRLAGVSNYLIGSDPSRWHTNIPTYGQVAYADVYRGVDLIYYGNQGQLEYDFTIRPGAPVGSVRLQVDGARSLSLDAQGNLVIATAAGNVVEHVPVVYQQIAGARHAVAGRYVLENGGTVGFAVGGYDASLPLVIDPVLNYSDLVGGSANSSGLAENVAYAIAVDQSGSAYIGGFTYATNFPTVNPFQASNPDTAVGFVSKMNATGTGFVYSTYIGGGGEAVRGLAVDSAGDLYIAGQTDSSNFPTAGTPFQPTLKGDLDAVVAKLNPTGTGLIYSTFLGGTFQDAAYGIAIDATGNAYVTGVTFSSDFPLAGALFSTGHTFVAKLNPSGSAVVYSTRLGGNTTPDQGYGIAVDASGEACVVGVTGAPNFPTVNAFQPTIGGSVDAFVTKFNAQGNGLVYSTFLGGNSGDYAFGVALDAAGDAYVVGQAGDSTFPTLAAIQPKGGGAFLAKFGPNGNAIYSTFLGGGSGDSANAVATDAAGNVYVAGQTGPNFPTVNAFQSNYGGGSDGFVLKMNSAGTTFAYASYLGGENFDNATGIAVDSAGNAYVTGLTYSAYFPSINGLYVLGHGSVMGFVSKITNFSWQAADVSVGSDNKTRLLWNNPNGSTVVWSLNGTAPAPGTVYGPFSGWSVRAIAAGSDGLTRVLWRNLNDGTTALWLVDANNVLQSAAVFGRLIGWTPTDVAVGSDNKTRILWTNTDGPIAVWQVDNSFNVSASIYGPIAGWTAHSITAGSDGLVRLLWTRGDGAAAVWVLGNDGTFQSAGVFGPINGWSAQDIAVGGDHQLRILWVNSNRAAVVWTVNSALGVSSGPVFGPYPGYVPERLSAGADGLVRLLWNNLNGTAAIWLLNLDDTFNSAATFGPF